MISFFYFTSDLDTFHLRITRSNHMDCSAPAASLSNKDVTAVSVNSLICYWHNLEGTRSVAYRHRGPGSRVSASVLCCVCVCVCVCVFLPSTMQSAGPELEDSFDFLFKIILIGDSDVGKTCVVQRFKSGIFIEKQQNTIGVDFTVRTLDIDGKKIKVSRCVC